MIGVFFIIFITEIILLFITINIIKIIRYKRILKNLDKEFDDLEIQDEKELKEVINIINKYKGEK